MGGGGLWEMSTQDTCPQRKSPEILPGFAEAKTFPGVALDDGAGAVEAMLSLYRLLE
jgi:hypothetical protein